MRVTVDNNVVISAFLWGGYPRRVLNAARSGAIDIFTSAELLAELSDVLSRRQFEKPLIAVNSSADTILHQYRALAHKVLAKDIEPVIFRDPDDDSVLACAISSNSDFVVTGDKDLLDVKEYRGIPILMPKDFLDVIEL
jgi:putative PIN family toxin of toxin-antitoxin system